MTSIEATEVKAIINKDYPTIQEQLNEELDRYVSTNNAKNGNHMTFVNLPYELRIAIVKARSKVSPGKIPVFSKQKQVSR